MPKKPQPLTIDQLCSLMRHAEAALRAFPMMIRDMEHEDMGGEYDPPALDYEFMLAKLVDADKSLPSWKSIQNTEYLSAYDLIVEALIENDASLTVREN